MMKFIRDERGSIVEKVAVMAGAVTLAAVLGANFLNKASSDPNSKLVSFLRGQDDLRLAKVVEKDQRGRDIDYTATASVHSQMQNAVIDPCTGRSK